jgi:hypothetical protein
MSDDVDEGNGNNGWTEERKREASERARAMHQEVVDPETGQRKFGGPQPGSGRPRKRPLGEELLKRAEEKSDEVIDALFSGLEAENKSARSHAAREIIKLEREESELQLKEDAYDKTDEGKLIELLGPALARLAERGALPALPSGPPTVDGSAEEVGVQPAATGGAGPEGPAS